MMTADLDAPLRVHLEMDAQRFGALLLGMVYQEASAYALLDEEGAIVEFKLFDTMDSQPALARDWPGGARIALYSNHPYGDLRPTQDDLRNLARLPGAALFVVCEGQCTRFCPPDGPESAAKVCASIVK